MTAAIAKETFLQPTNLHEAINIIKFLTTSHKHEISKLKDVNHKQAELIKKLEANRKQELEFLSNELHKYEVNLALRTETVTRQLAEKDEIIQKQLEKIEELNKKLRKQSDCEFLVPEIILGDSNSDSGVAMENDDSSPKIQEVKVDKPTRKCSRRFAESISFLRRVDFSPIKYKPCNRDGNKKKEDTKIHLNVPGEDKKKLSRKYKIDRQTSEDERLNEDAVNSDGSEPILIRPKKMNESMNNHFSDDGSEDTSEEVFDRVMTRSSVRRSVKANPKYKKINRTKAKLLEQSKLIS